MAATSADVSYLRFVLHKETDGVLMARKRTGPRGATVPEARELRALLRLMVEHGIEKVRLMGDDPAERADLAELISLIAGVEGIREVAMSTAGLGLNERVADLAQRGLQVVSYHIDTLKPERFLQITGRDACAEIWSTIEQSLASGLKVKMNVVLQRGVNDDEIDDFVNLTRERPIQVRFVEWNSCIERVAPPESFISTHEAMSAIKPPLIPRKPRPIDGPAMIYDIPTHAGSVGFVPNITEHFCGACNRIGLTDYGEITSCLFGRGLSLVRHLRSPNGPSSVSDFIERVLRRKVLLSARLEGYATAPSPSASQALEVTGLAE